MELETIGAGTVPATQREARQRTLKKGRVLYANRSISTDVLVRNLSTSGCKLQSQNDIPIPDHFDLEMEVGGWSAPCEVRWREGGLLGVRFLEPLSAAPSASTLAQSIQSTRPYRNTVRKR